MLGTGIRILESGEIFDFVKLRRDGEDVMRYNRGELVLENDAFERYLAEHPPAVLPASLAANAATEPGAELEVTVWLRERPGARIARDLWTAFRPRRVELAEEAQDIHRRARPRASLRPEEERAWVARLSGEEGLTGAPERHHRETLAAELDREERGLRRAMRERMAAAVIHGQTAFANWVRRLGGEVLATIEGQNAMTIRLPATALGDIAADSRVARILALPPEANELNIQGDSLGLPGGFWLEGVDGGLCDAGILDTGIQGDHPCFAGVTIMSDRGYDDPLGHGTACAGIIASQDPMYRGVAYGLDKIIFGSNASHLVMSDADWMVRVTWDDPEVINLSAGYGPANVVDDDAFDQFWDGLVDDHSALVVKSAGNEGDTLDLSLTRPAAAYNVLTVGDMEDRNTVSRGDDRICPTSSRGPTAGGRKKPDLVAPGHATRTASSSWESGSDFVDFGGTSAAAPHVTGAGVLLAHLRGSDDPKAIKAVLINSADAWDDGGTPIDTADDHEAVGSLWNRTYGWGYLDLWEAWFNGSDVFTGSLAAGDQRFFTGQLWNSEKATLVWHRHVGYDGASYPTAVEKLTDLDLLVYDEATGVLLDSSVSAVDNVEQVSVDRDGPVVLKVDVFGTIDPDVGNESFALATEENFLASASPILDFAVSPLLPVQPARAFVLTGMVLNPALISAHEARVTLDLPVAFSLVSGPNPRQIGSLAGGELTWLGWTLDPGCVLGSFDLPATLENFSYGERLVSGKSLTVIVDTTALPFGSTLRRNQAPWIFDHAAAPDAFSAVAVDPGLAARQVTAGQDPCVEWPVVDASFSGDALGLVVWNGHRVGGGPRYTKVDGGGGIHYGVASAEATLQGVDVTSSHLLAPDELMRLIEIDLVADELYEVAVGVNSGLPDLALAVYRPDRLQATRATADFATLLGGAGESGWLDFVAPLTGRYGIAVLNDNAAAGAFDLQVSESLFWSDFESGDLEGWSFVVP